MIINNDRPQTRARAISATQDAAREQAPVQQTRRSTAGAASDKIMTTIIGSVLLGGVLLSSAVILVGLLLLLASPGALTSNRTAVFPHTFSDLWVKLLTGHPQAIIVAGLLLLIA